MRRRRKFSPRIVRKYFLSFTHPLSSLRISSKPCPFQSSYTLQFGDAPDLEYINYDGQQVFGGCPLTHGRQLESAVGSQRAGGRRLHLLLLVANGLSLWISRQRVPCCRPQRNNRQFCLYRRAPFLFSAIFPTLLHPPHQRFDFSANPRRGACGERSNQLFRRLLSKLSLLSFNSS